MNKKVLTLCAGALLAGSLTAVAQNTTVPTKWVQVTAAGQFVDGAVYKVERGDSILTDGTSKVDASGMDYAVAAPIFDVKGNSADTLWTLTKERTGFSLKSNKSNTNPIVRINSSNELYTNQAASATATTAAFIWNEDGTLSLAGIDGLVHSYGGLYVPTDTTEARVAQVTFYMQQKDMSDSIPATSEEIASVDGAVYVVDADGNYIGVNTNRVDLQTRAVARNSDLVAVSFSDFGDYSDEEKKAFVWVAENGGLKSAYAVEDIYLTVNRNGAFTTSSTPVETTIENNVITANGNNAQIALITSEIQKPFEGSFNEADLANDTQVVLYAGDGNSAIDADGNVVSYDPQEAVPTVWNIVRHELSQSGKYELRLEDQDGNPLEVGGYYVTIDPSCVTWSDDDNNGTDDTYTITNPVLLTANGQYVGLVNGALALVNIYQATEFGLGDIEQAYVEAQYLLKDRFGDHFTLDITYTDTKGTSTTNDDVDYDLTSIFEGNLVPTGNVIYTGGEATFVKAAPGAEEFMLVNEDNEILAVNLDEDDRLSEAGEGNHVYPLTTISARQYINDQAETNPVYATTFRLEYVPGTDASDVTDITKIQALVNNSWVDLGCYLDKTVPTLVAATGTIQLLDVDITLNAGSIVNPQAWLTQPVYYKVTVKNTDKDAVHYDEILGLDQHGDIAYVAKAKTDQMKPEGQFAIDYVAANETANIPAHYTFTNRETGKAENTNSRDYRLLADRLYKIDDTTFAYLDGGHMDTLAIEPITTFTSADGFERFTASELNANTYNIAMNLLDETYLYTVENHNDRHRVGLDREDATNWRIAMSTVRVLDNAQDEIAIVPDTVTIAVPIHYYANATDKWVYTLGNEGKKAKYNNPNTALKVPTYVLLNTATDEYISGSSEAEETANEYYYCPSKTSATRFAFKQVGDSTVNLVPVYANYYWHNDIELKESAYNTYASSMSFVGNKVIGGTTSATGVLHDVDLYQATDNDLFRILETGAPTYKPLEQGDNIIISLEENNDNVLYEDGEFAGIDNRLAYDINPSLYVDTAYVNRAGNYRYEYLLGVNINRVDTLDECNNPNHDHLRTVFTEGRFLVNMRDSMEAEAENNVHTNKYAYDDEPKLAFVPGYHQNDTLYLTNEAGDVISKSFIGNDAPHFAKFAFKMINEENNEFIVEVGNYAAEELVTNDGYKWTVEKNEPTRGYLRWHNDNLVVTNEINNAARFTMEDTDLIATSNEEISAEAGAVSVVATDGAVVIKGAEGKNVVIATILGKVVANETINSDNETIAVPAGIAVVSVDGESFKVVVK